MTSQPLDILPMWAVYPVTAVLLFLVMEAGYRYAKAKNRAAPSKSDGGLSTFTGAILGLLAFLLAFVVAFGMNIYQERRQLVVEEANAIGTTYLRAGYLEDPYRTESRALLSEYLEWRVAAPQEGKLEEALTRSEEIHRELWALVEEWVAEGNTAATSGLYVSALNEVIDLHTERVVVSLQIRIPPMVMLAVYVIALVTMFLVGLQTGYAGSRNLFAMILMVLVLAAVLYVIVDLDRGHEGLLTVSQQALVDLQAGLPTLP
jgi:hypothetical protein